MPAADDRKIQRMPFGQLAAWWLATEDPILAGEFPPFPVNSRFAQFISRFDGKISRFLVHGNCLATLCFRAGIFASIDGFEGKTRKIPGYSRFYGNSAAAAAAATPPSAAWRRVNARRGRCLR
jgi:hypothetical protein